MPEFKPRPNVTAITYFVTPAGTVVDDPIDNGLPRPSDFALMVHRRGPDSWAVVRHGKCLSKTGKWHYESSPSARTDFFLKHHRFTLDVALALAVKAVEKVTVGNKTHAQWASNKAGAKR